MNQLIEGTVTVKFGDDINTDYIIPAYLLQEAWDKKFFADYAFERYSPDFIKTCRALTRKKITSSQLERISVADQAENRRCTRSSTTM